MGKPIPSVQAAAAAFSPESERLRMEQTKQQTAAKASASGWSLKPKGATELTASGDSLDNPSSPQYQAPHKKEQFIPGLKASAPDNPNNTAPGSSGLPHKFYSGWDKLLVTQKTICNKAMNLLLLLEAPQRYFTAMRSKTSVRKFNGVILDYRSDDEEVMTKQREAKENGGQKAG